MSATVNCRGGDQQIAFYPQVGIKVPVYVLRPGPENCDPAKGTLIAVDDRGKASLIEDEIVHEAHRRGWVVWMMDPREIGEMTTHAEPFLFAMSLMLGENVTWRQALDILRLVRRIGGEKAPFGGTILYARGPIASLAASYVAAVTDKTEIGQVVLRDAPSSFQELANAAPSVTPFGVQRWFEIPDLWRAAKGRVFRITHPEELVDIDW